MAKPLKDILKGVKSSKKVTNDLGGYKPKAGDEEDFAKKHEIEKHEDPMGNGDDVFNATNVKHSMEGETRHGHKKPKDEKVYEEKKTCNMTEEGTMCEVHGMSDCSKGGKKVLKEKEPVSEEWYSEKGGERTFHKNQKDAMKHARQIGGKVGATHGAQGQKASVALGWDAKQKQGLNLTSKADQKAAEQKKKAAEKYFAAKAKKGPWGIREAALPVKATKDAWGPAAAAITGVSGAIMKALKGDDKKAAAPSGPMGRDSNIKLKKDPFDSQPERGDQGKRDSSIRDADDVTGGNAEAIPKIKIDGSAKPGPSVADFVGSAKKRISSKQKPVNEVLSKSADAGEWISDFVHSDNPKFKGKSKEKRKQMALAAYYAKQRNEEAEIEEALKGKQHKIDKNKNGKIDAQDFKLLRKEEADLEEAVKTGNEGHGYHGEAYGAATSDDKMAEAGKAYAKAHSLVKQHAAEHLKDVKNPNKMVKHYLDSQYGRHLHGNEHDAGYVKKDFAHFKKKYKPEMHEEVEQIDEISKKTAYAAYADRANDDYSKDYGEKLHGMIKKKWGDKAGEDAEAHASARHFGRGGKSSGTDKLSGIWNRSSDQMRTTKSGKINKQDTKAKASEIKSRLGSHKKANLPEDLAVPLLGSMSGEKIGKTNLKKKVKKEQTGPDTPLTLPNMSVDVNTGRNV